MLDSLQTTLVALQTQPWLFYTVVGLISLFVGSFLNVVIHRLPIMMENAWRNGCEELAAGTLTPDDSGAITLAGSQLDAAGADGIAADSATASANHTTNNTQDDNSDSADVFNLAVPRSRCPSCNQLIKARQNIPVLSYLLLGGKCANCKSGISIRYPLVEVTTAALALICAWQFGPTLQGVAAIVITWFLVALSAIDFDTQLLPDDLTLPLLWMGLIASTIGVFVGPGTAIIGAAAGYLSLWSVFWLFKLITGKEGMGYGDFKLLAALGAWLGWQALPMIILLSSLVGAVVGITLIVVRGRDRQIPIPFGPYLAAAGWLAMLWGENLTRAYNNLFAF